MSGEVEGKRTLYEWSEQYNNIVNLLEDNPDLDDADFQNALDVIQESASEKIINTAELITKFKDDVELIKKREEELKTLKQSKLNTVDRLQEYLKFHMESMDIPKVDNGVRKISLRNTKPVVELLDFNKVPNEFKKYTTQLSIDHTKLPKKYQKDIVKSNSTVDKIGLYKHLKELEDSEGKFPEYAVLKPNKTIQIK